MQIRECHTHPLDGQSFSALAARVAPCRLPVSPQQSETAEPPQTRSTESQSSSSPCSRAPSCKFVYVVPWMHSQKILLLDSRGRMELRQLPELLLCFQNSTNGSMLVPGKLVVFWEGDHRMVDIPAVKQSRSQLPGGCPPHPPRACTAHSATDEESSWGITYLHLYTEHLTAVEHSSPADLRSLDPTCLLYTSDAADE